MLNGIIISEAVHPYPLERVYSMEKKKMLSISHHLLIFKQNLEDECPDYICS
jgi:hypothetical protein